MATNKRWHLISYDIRDEKRLRHVAKHMKGYGVRMQYSIFRCRLSERQLERLRWELASMTGKDDRILYVTLCPHCASHVTQSGQIVEWTEDFPKFEIV